MKIVVLLKVVPDTNGPRTLNPQTRRLERLPGASVLDPLGEFALEAALRLREIDPAAVKVAVLTMAPFELKETLRKALALGADEAVLVSDPGLAGSDGFTTSVILAAALAHIGFDLIMTGTQSADGGGGYLAAMIASHLDVPLQTHVGHLDIREGRVVGTGMQAGYHAQFESAMPTLVSISKEAETPRYASLKGIMAAKRKEITVLTLADFAMPDHGADGLTEILDVTLPPPRALARIIKMDDAQTAARAVLDFMRERQVIEL